MKRRLNQLISLCCAAALLLSCAGISVSAAGVGTVTVLWNGAEAALSHAPFEENGEVYLPLRETLNACGVADDAITYHNGIVRVAFSSPVRTEEAIMADFQINNTYVTFDLDKQAERNTYLRETGGSRSLTHPVKLLGDTAYAPLGAFIRLKHFDVADPAGQNIRSLNLDLLQGLEIRQTTADGKINVLLEKVLPYQTDQPLTPASYYQENENVLIGTAAQQDSYGYNPLDENGIPHPVKRILTNDAGEVIAVVPVENQKHEAMNVSGYFAFRGVFDWAAITNDSVTILSGDGAVMRTGLLIHDPATASGGVMARPVFYIPLDLIVQPQG